MPEQSPQPKAVTPKKSWYMKWWIWLIAACVVIGGIGTLVNPEVTDIPADEADAAPTASAETEEATPAELPNYASRPGLEQFLNNSGVVFDDLQVNARKVVIYVPTETTREHAQEIANDAMLFLCSSAKFPPGYVKTNDKVNIFSEGYHADDHPITYAQEEDVCKG